MTKRAREGASRTGLPHLLDRTWPCHPRHACACCREQRSPRCEAGRRCCWGEVLWVRGAMEWMTKEGSGPASSSCLCSLPSAAPSAARQGQARKSRETAGVQPKPKPAHCRPRWGSATPELCVGCCESRFSVGWAPPPRNRPERPLAVADDGRRSQVYKTASAIQ